MISMNDIRKEKKPKKQSSNHFLANLTDIKNVAFKRALPDRAAEITTIITVLSGYFKWQKGLG